MQGKPLFCTPNQTKERLPHWNICCGETTNISPSVLWLSMPIAPMTLNPCCPTYSRCPRLCLSSSMADILVKGVARDVEASSEVPESLEEGVRQIKDRVTCTPVPSDNDKLVLHGSTFVEATGLSQVPDQFFKRLPVLVIDEMNVSSTKNELFIRKVYQAASLYHVCVFVVTRVRKTATAASSWNGGTKIVPSRGCVSNPWPAYKDFVVGTAQWNGLHWSKESLLVYVKCKEPLCPENWTGDELIEAGMTPRNAANAFEDSFRAGNIV